MSWPARRVIKQLSSRITVGAITVHVVGTYSGADEGIASIGIVANVTDRVEFDLVLNGHDDFPLTNLTNFPSQHTNDHLGPLAQAFCAFQLRGTFELATFSQSVTLYPQAGRARAYLSGTGEIPSSTMGVTTQSGCSLVPTFEGYT